MFFLLLCLLSLSVVLVTGKCPNSCSGHGRCTGVARCSCFAGWAGGDCSIKSCPQGPAWGDVSVGVDTGHSLADCSARGVCDTRLGACVCFPGFEGPSCNRLTCSGGCSGRGECVTLRRYAQTMDPGTLPVASPYTNIRAPFTYASHWDAEMIQGCACDVGYGGAQCEQRVCPVGDDPLTPGQVDEVQLLRCDIDPTDPAYTGVQFTLGFRGAVTRPFAPSISAWDLRVLLQELPTLTSVSVAYTSGSTFCNAAYATSPGYNPLSQPASSNIVSLTFLTEHGPLPRVVVLDAASKPLYGAKDNLIVVATSGESLAATGPGSTPGTVAVALLASQSGTKEAAPCSARGVCSPTSGLCTCFPGFGPSDRMGGVGNNGDCGHAYFPITSCPGSGGLECSGNGVCGGYPTYACACNSGWGGGDCSVRTCPSGPAWFAYPTATNQAHTPALCSGKGQCDSVSGQCRCLPNFTGHACERMTCPSTTASTPCSSHGTCMTQAEMAALGTTNGNPTPFTYGADPTTLATWDRGSARACVCDAGYTGADCSQRSCPFGNDITLLEANAAAKDGVQALVCRLLVPGDPSSVPTVTLSFRGVSTPPLATTASAATVQAALSALSTIGGSITVAFDAAAGPTLCAASPPQTITFTFHTAHGAVPPIQVALSAQDPVTGFFATGLGWKPTQLEFTGGSLAAPSTPLVYQLPNFPASGILARVVLAGASGWEECSNRGLCDRVTGVCQCFIGYGSSNNDRAPGTNANCGWREPVQIRSKDDQGVGDLWGVYPVPRQPLTNPILGPLPRAP